MDLSAKIGIDNFECAADQCGEERPPPNADYPAALNAQITFDPLPAPDEAKPVVQAKNNDSNRNVAPAEDNEVLD
jgi:hypothetical protein